MGAEYRQVPEADDAALEIRRLLHELEDYVIQLQLIGLREEEQFDHGAAISEIFRAGYEAKRTAKKIEEAIIENERPEFREELVALDDERAFEAWNAWIRVVRRKKGLPIKQSYGARAGEVIAFADCETQGNRFIYRLAVKNESKYVVTNPTLSVVAYPQDCMRPVTELVTRIRRLKAGAVEDTRFVFIPSKDCVEGKIICTVSYIDHKDQLHTIHVKPYRIASVCDMLRPYESSNDMFEETMRSLLENDTEVQLDWNVELLIKKAETVLPMMNFYLLDAEKKSDGDTISGRIRGFALGKYTGKRVAVELHVQGFVDEDVSRVKAVVYGDDKAMLPTTINEILEKMDSWTCTECGVLLNPEAIMTIEARKTTSCRYCGAPLTLDLYSKSDKKSEYSIMGQMSESMDENQISKIEHLLEQEGYTETGRKTDTNIVRGISVARGCEIVGGDFLYKVKVQNASKYVVTNVVVNIVGYPRDCLRAKSEETKTIPRIEVGGFRSPEFVFAPTKDCVEGTLLASVFFLDFQENPHSIHSEPYIIKSVCDLLQPCDATLDGFKEAISEMKSDTREFEADFSPRLMTKKIRNLLPSLNFNVVDVSEKSDSRNYEAMICGYAEGKYTGKQVASVISVSGERDIGKANIEIRVLGEDITMLPVAIGELREGIRSWSCPFCSSILSEEAVIQMKATKPIACTHCNHTLTIELFEKEISR